MYIYPDNLKAKAKLWLWELKDVAVIGIGLLLSVLALTQGAGMFLLCVAYLVTETYNPFLYFRF